MCKSLRYRLFLLLPMITILTGNIAYSQSDLSFTQHWEIPSFYNPSFTGESDYLRIRTGGRLQWVGIENYPKNIIGEAETPLKIAEKRIGTGVKFSYLTLDDYKNIYAGLQGSYKFNLGKGRLSIGLEIGYFSTEFKQRDQQPDKDPDQEFNTVATDDLLNPKMRELKGSSIDVSLGILYSIPVFHIGLSILHITNPKIELSGKEGYQEISEYSENLKSNLRRSLYFDSGGNIKIHNTLFTLQPSLFLTTDFKDLNGQITMRTNYNGFLTFGLAYRWKHAIYGIIEVDYKNFFIGYSYGLPLSSYPGKSSGNHELILGYRLKLDFSSKNKYGQKSIRIM